MFVKFNLACRSEQERAWKSVQVPIVTSHHHNTQVEYKFSLDHFFFGKRLLGFFEASFKSFLYMDTKNFLFQVGAFLFLVVNGGDADGDRRIAGKFFSESMNPRKSRAVMIESCPKKIIISVVCGVVEVICIMCY